MKKIILTLVVILFTQFGFSNNEKDSLLNKARENTISHNYPEAIKLYKRYIEIAEEKELKNIYVEIANCYFKNNDERTALKYIKESIVKYGFSEEDFIYNTKLDSGLSNYALAALYDDLDTLQAKYAERQK